MSAEGVQQETLFSNSQIIELFNKFTASQQQINELTSALKESQIAQAKMEEEMRNLRLNRENTVPICDDATLDSGSASKTSSQMVSAGKNELIGSQKESALRAGKKFAIVGEAWVSPEQWARLLGKKKPATIAVHTGRYGSEKSVEEGILVDLFDCVPEDCHTFLENKYGKFIKVLRGAVEQSRQNAVTRVKSCVSKIFPNLPADQFKLAAINKQAIPELRKLLGYDETKKRYDSLPPILYPNARKSATKIFRNEALPKILQAILCGPSSLDPAEGRKKTKHTISELCGIAEITPGAIAFSAILAIFILSPDREFSRKGKESQIEYATLFQRYKEIIVTKYDTPHIQQTLTIYNESIFATNTIIPSASSCRNPGESDDEFEDALAALEQADSSDEHSDSIMDVLQPVTFDEPVGIQADVPDAIAPVVANQVLELEEHTPGPTIVPAEGQSESPNEPDTNTGTGRGRGRGRGRGNGRGRGRGRGEGGLKGSAKPTRTSSRRKVNSPVPVHPPPPPRAHVPEENVDFEEMEEEVDGDGVTY